MEKPQPRVLPFKKRAIKRPTSDQATDKDKDKTANDDSINMFRKRQDAKYFAEIEKKAAEKKAAKNVAVKGPPAVKQLKQKTSSSGKKSTSAHKEVRQGSKRQHLILSDDDDDDPLPNSPTRKSPRDSKKKSPGRTRDFLKKARLSSDSPRPSRRGETPQGIISLSSDDDSVNATPTKPRNKGKGKERAIGSSPTNGTGLPPSARSPPSSDRPEELQFGTDPVEYSDDGDDDIGAAYIRSAQERAKQRKADQEAQEGREVQVVDIIIVSKLEGIDVVKIKTEVTRQTENIKKAWQAKSIQKLDIMSSTGITPATIESMFLTWRGVKLSDALTLERQGMTSLDSRGNFISAKTEQRGSHPGFQGSDKILFEAWTDELFEKHRLEEKKQRRRAMGDFDEESESEGEPEPQPEQIRISLKSREYEPFGMTVRPNTTIDGCIKAFRKLANKQKELPAEKIVQIIFDGEKLPSSSTIDDAGIEDMDALEVHIKDA